MNLRLTKPEVKQLQAIYKSGGRVESLVTIDGKSKWCLMVGHFFMPDGTYRAKDGQGNWIVATVDGFGEDETKGCSNTPLYIQHSRPKTMQ